MFNIKAEIETLAEELVSEALLPLLRKLQTDRAQKWNLQLINICVANMVAGATDDKQGTGRDIGVMFKRQEDVLRPFRIDPDHITDTEMQDIIEDDLGEETVWDESGITLCSLCGHSVPMFAASAHSRYHEMGQ